MKKAIAIIIVILVLPFIVNIPDATLSDDAQKLINAYPAYHKPETDNGFYALLGFETQVGKDIYEAGRQAFMGYADSQNNDPPWFEFMLQDIIGPVTEMPVRSHIPECNPERKQACLDFYGEKKDELDRLQKDNELLLARYNSLNDYIFFQNPVKPAPWEPLVRLEGPIFAGHLLTIGNAASLFNRESYSESIKNLNSDIILWRKLLAGASDLPGKTYALLALRLNYSLLMEMLERLPIGEISPIINQDITAPLTPEEISTDVVWDRQFQALARSLSNNRWPFGYSQLVEMSFWDKCFCKPNATLNDAYTMFHLLKKLSAAEPERVETIRKEFSEHLGEISKLSLYKLYNPIGKIFVSTSFDDSAGIYWNRDIHSLDKLISQVRNKVLSLNENITSKKHALILKLPSA